MIFSEETYGLFLNFYLSISHETLQVHILSHKDRGFPTQSGKWPKNLIITKMLMSVPSWCICMCHVVYVSMLHATLRTGRILGVGMM